MKPLQRWFRRLVGVPTPRTPESSDPEWQALKQFWIRREAALARHRVRISQHGQGLGLPSYQHGASRRVNCTGSVAIATGCGNCDACTLESILLFGGHSAFHGEKRRAGGS